MEFTAHECGFDTRIDTLSLGRAVPQSDAVAVNIVQTGSDVGSLPLSGRLFQGEKRKRRSFCESKALFSTCKSREVSFSSARNLKGPAPVLHCHS